MPMDFPSAFLMSPPLLAIFQSLECQIICKVQCQAHFNRRHFCCIFSPIAVNTIAKEVSTWQQSKPIVPIPRVKRATQAKVARVASLQANRRTLIRTAVTPAILRDGASTPGPFRMPTTCNHQNNALTFVSVFFCPAHFPCKPFSARPSSAPLTILIACHKSARGLFKVRPSLFLSFFVYFAVFRFPCPCGFASPFRAVCVGGAFRRAVCVGSVFCNRIFLRKKIFQKNFVRPQITATLLAKLKWYACIVGGNSRQSFRAVW